MPAVGSTGRPRPGHKARALRFRNWSRTKSASRSSFDAGTLKAVSFMPSGSKMHMVVILLTQASWTSLVPGRVSRDFGILAYQAIDD